MSPPPSTPPRALEPVRLASRRASRYHLRLAIRARIHAPVYAFYAGNDARVDATIPDATAGMKAAGKTYEPVTYDGAGHGFMRAGEAPDASDANKKARADSWTRLKSLLAMN
jgi:dienelactone hydrolase